MILYTMPRTPEGPADFCRTPSAGDMLRVIDMTCQTRTIGAIIGVPD